MSGLTDKKQALVVIIGTILGVIVALSASLPVNEKAAVGIAVFGTIMAIKEAWGVTVPIISPPVEVAAADAEVDKVKDASKEADKIAKDAEDKKADDTKPMP
jgi:disulfide bond formation protein DsbB